MNSPALQILAINLTSCCNLACDHCCLDDKQTITEEIVNNIKPVMKNNPLTAVDAEVRRGKFKLSYSANLCVLCGEIT